MDDVVTKNKLSVEFQNAEKCFKLFKNGFKWAMFWQKIVLML